VAGSCEHGNEPLLSIKDGGNFYYLSKYQLLKKGSTKWSELRKYLC
jgi:hypothetical protein